MPEGFSVKKRCFQITDSHMLDSSTLHSMLSVQSSMLNVLKRTCVNSRFTQFFFDTK